MTDYTNALAKFLQSEKQAFAEPQRMLWPFRKDPYTGDMGLGHSMFTESLQNGLQFPAKVMRGEVPLFAEYEDGKTHYSPEMMQGANDTAGLAMTGAIGLPKPSNAIGSGGGGKMVSQPATNIAERQGASANLPQYTVDAMLNLKAARTAYETELADAIQRFGLSPDADAGALLDALSARKNSWLFKLTGGAKRAEQAESRLGASYKKIEDARRAYKSNMVVDQPNVYEAPSDFAARMANAQDIGFDTSKTYVHASRSPPFESFKRDLNSENEIAGTYFQLETGDPHAIARAQGQAMVGMEADPSAHVRRVHLRTKNPFKMDKFDFEAVMREAFGKDTPIDANGNDVTRALAARGYDSVVSNTPAWSIVFDPSNIRSINAAFDPAKSSSANLLAANPREGAAVASATNAEQREDDNPMMNVLRQYGLVF